MKRKHVNEFLRDRIVSVRSLTPGDGTVREYDVDQSILWVLERVFRTSFDRTNRKSGPQRNVFVALGCRFKAGLAQLPLQPRNKIDPNVWGRTDYNTLEYGLLPVSLANDLIIRK